MALPPPITIISCSSLGEHSMSVPHPHAETVLGQLQGAGRGDRGSRHFRLW